MSSGVTFGDERSSQDRFPSNEWNVPPRSFIQLHSWQNRWAAFGATYRSCTLFPPAGHLQKWCNQAQFLLFVPVLKGLVVSSRGPFTRTAGGNLQVTQTGLAFSSSLDLWIFRRDSQVMWGNSFESIHVPLISCRFSKQTQTSKVIPSRLLPLLSYFFMWRSIALLHQLDVSIFFSFHLVRSGRKVEGLITVLVRPTMYLNQLKKNLKFWALIVSSTGSSTL